MIESLVECIGLLNPQFKNDGFFKRPIVVEAALKLDIDKDKAQACIIKLSNKMSRGLYKYTGVVATKPVVNLEQKVALSIPHQDSSVNLVPPRDPSYVAFGNYKDVEKIIKSRIFYPVYITGPSGNGKSSMILDICGKHGIDLIRVNCSSQTDEDKLIGSKSLVDGNIVVVEGALIKAMRGAVLLLEEIDSLDSNLALQLNTALEGRPYYFTLTGEYVIPRPGFNIIGIGNTKGQGNETGKYIGTNIQNSSLLERFGCTFEQEFPTQAIELKMVLGWMEKLNCVNTGYAESLVKWTDAIRKTEKDGGVEDSVSTRRLQHIVNAYAIFNDPIKAVELCTNRFDKFTSSAFTSLFSKIYVQESNDSLVPVKC